MMLGVVNGRLVTALTYTCREEYDGVMTARIDLLGVARRMQRRGVGSCMVTWLLRSNPCGARCFVADVLSVVESFYERLGFRPVKAYVGHRVCKHEVHGVTGAYPVLLQPS